jgi:EAL domain-containing protein (putative c-di-GMP-specific phosphodiesterase class I)
MLTARDDNATRFAIIDDDPWLVDLLGAQLSGLGFPNVVPFDSASDALALIENDAASIQVILCDLQMPGMDGVEFMRNLARVGYQGDLLLISGEDRRILQTAENLARVHKLNVLGALPKPVTNRSLEQALGKRSAVKSAARPVERKNYGAEELRDAISRGELVNRYQPKVALATGVVIGVETLVRWQHPRDGLVMPGDFIPAAEEHRLIDPLTRQVFTNALRQARHWLDAGLHLQVAVNVSMDNLNALEFPDFITREAAEAGVPVTNLVLEITESRLMRDQTTCLDILSRLRLKRICLSIDDFGTGHSSLSQLRDIPFDELKVDRSFVHGVCRNPSLRAIFNASLGMARELGMKVVAEGVENQEDWDFLRNSGCDVAQGYFIAKPMAAEELSRWIVDWESLHCSQRRAAG